jgi:hypothetical protein
MKLVIALLKKKVTIDGLKASIVAILGIYSRQVTNYSWLVDIHSLLKIIYSWLKIIHSWLKDIYR